MLYRVELWQALDSSVKFAYVVGSAVAILALISFCITSYWDRIERQKFSGCYSLVLSSGIMLIGFAVIRLGG